VTRYFCT